MDHENDLPFADIKMSDLQCKTNKHVKHLFINSLHDNDVIFTALVDNPLSSSQ